MVKAAQAIPNKLFFKIGEVCEITDTQPYVLRFWESEFPQLAPRKNRSGQRVYQRKDIETVIRIKKLLYEEEYTIAGARRKLDDDGPASSGGPARDEPMTEPLLLVAGAETRADSAGAEAGPLHEEEEEDEVEADHPVDVLTSGTGRRLRAIREAAEGDPARRAKMQKALTDLKQALREVRALLTPGDR